MQQLIVTITEPLPLPVEPTENSPYDYLFLLRLLFYGLVIVKLVELSFFRRKRFSLKERIYRKFLFANGELLRQFSDHDKTVMQTTLNNTIKNASVEWNHKNHKVRHTQKRVNFQTDRNTYIPPREREEDKDVFLDIKEETAEIEIEPDQHHRLFEDKKLEDEFVEREDLLGLNQQEGKVQTDGQIAESEGMAEIAALNSISESLGVLNSQIEERMSEQVNN